MTRSRKAETLLLIWVYICFLSKRYLNRRRETFSRANVCVNFTNEFHLSPYSGSESLFFPATGSCSDSIANCADYTTSVCTNADYTQWVSENCPAYCNACGSSPGGRYPIHSMSYIPPFVLFKGTVISPST